MIEDYRKYYHLENYLFSEVNRKYKEQGYIEAFDFFCIIIWKANRSKSKIAKLLLSKNHNNLAEAVKDLTLSLSQVHNNKERLKILISDWKFRLPMASAILSVLYSKDFTIYDMRICDIIGDFEDIQNKTKFDSIWEGYQKYIEAVKKAVNIDISLRDKDRFLWGKSFRDQLINDIVDNFKVDKKKGITIACT